MSTESVMLSDYLIISSSAIPFSFCLQSFPPSGSFPMSWLFTVGGQSIGASASASVLPVNIQGWFPLGLIGLILWSKGLKSLLQHHSSKASILQHSAFFMAQISHPYMTTGKTIALTIQTFVSKVISLLFNMFSSFVIAFLPRRMLDPTKKKIPHVQGQRRPNKMVGGAQLCLEWNLRPARDAWRANFEHTGTQERSSDSTRDWARPAFECLSVSCEGTGQQWPAAGTWALTAAGLGVVACGISPLGGGHISSTVELPSRPSINWGTIIPKKFLHCCKSSRAHNRYPNLGSQQKDWEPPEKQTFGGHKQNLVHTRTQEKEAVTAQEPEPDLPVNARESPVEASVNMPQGQGYWLQQSWEAQHLWPKSFWRRSPLPPLHLS